MKKILQTCLVFLLMVTSVWAQERTVSGRVTSSEDGASLPGVNVIVKGTSNGTVTDADGRYTLSISSTNAILVFSFIGLQSQELSVGERTVVDVALSSDITQLSEIVVTAQGLERDERSLGYSLQSVKGKDLAQRSETGLLNTLQGKLSGVNITGASGGAGASTNINIRGVTSLGNNNQPLIVVDGIIFDNSTSNTTNSLFGTQPSNRLNDISPENIESLNVLKGPAAAALYGSRAANGVIVITTKKGGTTSGKTEVTITSSVNWQNAFGLPELQNQYGQGVNNDFNNQTLNSWGPAFGGALTEVTTLQGDVVPYRAYEDNVSGFFQTGRIVQNGVNIASGDKDKNMNLSISSTFQEGIIPSTDFSRNSVQFGGGTKLKNGLKFNSSLTYVQTKQGGVTQGNGGSALGQITRIPRSYDLLGRPFEDPLTGRSIYYSTTQNHPLWSTKYEQLNTQVDRVFGFMTLAYDIKPWLNVSYRATADTYIDRRQLNLAIGSARTPTGQIQENLIYNSELNGDLIITASKDNFLVEGLSASALVGQNVNQRSSQNVGADATSLTISGFQNINAGSIFTGAFDVKTKRRLVGLYTDINFGYKDYLYLELQGRVDKSSTLPEANNTFFYPSVSASFVPTAAFNIESNILSYAKVRANWAKVGNDANPYLTGTFFVPSAFGNNVASATFPITVGAVSVPGFQPAARLGNNTLTPEFTTAWEIGGNVGLFQNKLSVDVGYFSSSSTDQILNVAISNASGFDTRTANVGEMTNKGWEVEVSANILKIGDFHWDISGNWTRIRNEVVEIIEGVESSTIPGNAFIGISPSFKKGSPYGVIIGTAYTKNAEGQRLVNPATGAYVPGTPNTVIADPNRTWIAGLTNTFTYKGISLSMLLDVKYGGDLYSFGWVDLKNNGSLAITGIDRDQPRILEGVIDNGDGTFTDNYIQIPAQTYWGALGGLASEAAVFDATTYRLRELALNYSLPKSLLSGTPFGDVSVGVSGRNLWFFAPYAPGDPELNTQGAGNIQGMDLNGAPNTRNYGFNVRLTF
jgi:TonB-linked SusC/RagA family outer membrane protein